MPFAFQVVVWVLIILVMAVVKGLVDMFVDDMIGVGHVDSWNEDMMSAITIMKALLGDDAVSSLPRRATTIAESRY